MDKIFKCRLDGLVMQGATEEELVAQVERHLAEDHPELVGTFSRDDILAEIRGSIEAA
jgi:uncharacterized protein DUF1059